MAGWTAAGTMAGYDPATRALKKGRYQFSTAGSVDVGAITRLQYLPHIHDTASTPLGFFFTAPFSFTDADFNANGGTGSNVKLGLTAFFVPASYWAAGKVPTPQEIYDGAVNSYRKNLEWTCFDSTVYVTGGHFSTTFVFRDTWASYGGYFSPNTKYWVLIAPVNQSNQTSTLTPLIRTPIKGTAINSAGRALSFWTNRPPGKPKIILPVTGTAHAPGEVFDFTFTQNDPDAVTPVDAENANADLGGVQVQYAPAPMPNGPAPEWKNLQFAEQRAGDTFKGLWDLDIPADGAWVLPGTKSVSVLEKQKFSIIGGLVNAYDATSGQAVLPGGVWQLRVRTTDVGHPYPLQYRTAAGKYPNVESIDAYQSDTLSPWSDPVTVTITSQVPPPLVLDPSRERAVEIDSDSTLSLSYQYRNTFVPPKAQYERYVQMRKVGDPDWTLIDKSFTASTVLTVPLSAVVAPFVPVSRNFTFEDGTNGGWGASSYSFGGNAVDPVPPGTTYTAPTVSGAHSGSRVLRVTVPSSSSTTDYSTTPPTTTGSVYGPNAYYVADLGQSDQISVNAWVRFTQDLRSTAQYVSVACNVLFVDDNNAVRVDSYDKNIGGAQVTYKSNGNDAGTNTTTWLNLVVPTVRKPQGATKVMVTIAPSVFGDSASTNPNTITNFYRSYEIDDVQITDATTDVVKSFTVEPSSHYEWRARTVDVDVIESSYSEVGRFWTVPPAKSGTVRPVSDVSIEGATLGRGTHTVEVYRRGGLIRLGVLGGVSSVRWGRKRDEVSEATISFSGWDIDSGRLLARLRTWAHEVVIWRDNGYSKDRVWEGPITLLTDDTNSGKFTISAKDILGYSRRRSIATAMDDSRNGASVVSRATRLIQDGFARDDPNMLAYLTPIISVSDGNQYRSTPAFSRYIYEEIDDMASNSGLDYTTVGRSILLWGTKNRIGTLPEFRNEHLGASPIISEYGMSAANFYTVSDGGDIYGSSDRLNGLTSDPDYGLVEMLSSSWASDATEDVGTYTQEGVQKVRQGFKDSAEHSLSSRWPPPLVVRVPDNTSLNPNTPISIQQLVPGVIIPLRATGLLRSVTDNQKLDEVNVTEEAGKETITVVMSVFTGEDSDMSDGDDVGDDS